MFDRFLDSRVEDVVSRAMMRVDVEKAINPLSLVRRLAVLVLSMASQAEKSRQDAIMWRTRYDGVVTALELANDALAATHRDHDEVVRRSSQDRRDLHTIAARNQELVDELADLRTTIDLYERRGPYGK